MKKFVGLLLLGALLVFPLSAYAEIIGNVSLQEAYTSPTGYVSFPSQGAGNYYLNYSVSLNGGAYLQAFCVENQDGPGSSAKPYTLLAVNSSLADFGLDPDRYLAAAWVADLWASGGASKAAAQIAIWEIIFDWGGLNLASGNFWSDNIYNSAAQTILNGLPSQLPSSSSWALAVNPQVAEGGQVENSIWQNYLVRVPEPLTMILFGLGLIGLAGIRRKE